jgi:hypothetical protein
MGKKDGVCRCPLDSWLPWFLKVGSFVLNPNRVVTGAQSQGTVCGRVAGWKTSGVNTCSQSFPDEWLKNMKDGLFKVPEEQTNHALISIRQQRRRRDRPLGLSSRGVVTSTVPADASPIRLEARGVACPPIPSGFCTFRTGRPGLTFLKVGTQWHGRWSFSTPSQHIFNGPQIPSWKSTLYVSAPLACDLRLRVGVPAHSDV